MNRGSIDAVGGRAQNHCGFGDRTAAGTKLTPMSAGSLDGNLEFLLLQHPVPRAAGSPTGRSFFLTTSHVNRVVIEAIKANRLDFARAQFYRSSHLATGGLGRAIPNQCYGELRGENLKWFVTLTDPFTRRAFL
jgi:hypothetical protein